MELPSHPTRHSGSSHEHVTVNRHHWNDQAHDWVKSGERGWTSAPSWGIWHIPEASLHLLPEDMRGTKAVELGCGTAYVSAWMERRGAVVAGIDVSERQLSTARKLARTHDSNVSLVQASAESIPFPDGHFDFAISEYGAALWCDPFVWLPEARRVIRPGGELVFLSCSTLALLCSPRDGSLPVTERLERDYFSIHRLDWRNAVDVPGGIEFGLPISSWFKLLREVGFEVVDFTEIQAPRNGAEVSYFATAEWAARYPSEQVFKVRRNG